MRRSYLDSLCRSEIFRDFEPDHLEEILASATTTLHQRGDAVFHYQDTADRLFVVLSGVVSILLDPSATGLIEREATSPTEVSRLSSGCSFGELAMLNGEPRSASAIAVEEDTEVLSIPYDALAQASQANPLLGHRLMRNLAVTISSTVQSCNQAIIRELLGSYFVRAIAEEISGAAHRADPLTPIQTTVTLRDSSTFLAVPDLFPPQRLPERQDVELFVFASADLLHGVVGEGSPSGEVVFNVLFFLIRTGSLPAGVDPLVFSHSPPAGPSQQPSLVVMKSGPRYSGPVVIEWELKGSRYDPHTRRSAVSLLLYVHEPGGASTFSEVEKLIAGVDMKIQHTIQGRLPKRDYGGYRVLTLHHRTHEVARTLRSLHELGFKLDAFIGIPYGDASWTIAHMLDHASNRQFRCLKAIVKADVPTEFAFDFAKSSLLRPEETAKLDRLYRDRSVAGDYLSAMLALVELQLERSLVACRENHDRLLIYEDGGYVVPLVHDIFHDRTHRLHQLVRASVQDSLIAGAVEVTTAGERRTRAALAASPSGPLMPVLSTAREDVKLVFESIGVAEAVLQAASTALGNLGLPAFGARRVGVVGGNGAIGVRLVEKLVLAHNSVRNTFCVDVCDEPFRGRPPAGVPLATHQTAYLPITVVPVDDDELPLCLDGALHDPCGVIDIEALWGGVDAFLTATRGSPTKLLVSNADPDSRGLLTALTRRASERHGYEQVSAERINHGVRHSFVRGETAKSIEFLGQNVVFQYKRLERLIRSGIDTVVGITGLPVVDEADFNAFLEREAGPTGTDQLVLVSGSSKDYEFKKVITLLNRLIGLLAGRIERLSEEERVASLATLYNSDLCFMRDEYLQSLREPVLALTRSHPEVDPLVLADRIRSELSTTLSIRRDVRPEIGSVYEIDSEGGRKRLVMLSDGFVVNFFASFEKGVKTEYIDPIVTLQMLGLVRFADASRTVPNGLHGMHEQLEEGELATIWSLIDDQARPLDIVAPAFPVSVAD